ncbi:helix-turn-helix domain-containing protein [Thermosulfurimonas dismutans]|uniref:Helix-turn-helix domain-containing protein n=1 Tax=Thermosulfurimonas dismutans TaxID=999894 RepID=A0A179D4M0_9BACT|nr:helix-turn-helix domain-containing protein [Thermosulfurimonas dismutans]OAQ21030.1 hypothetical protein TDIS_0956 [Thermosulfurimonas dismutans]
MELTPETLRALIQEAVREALAEAGASQRWLTLREACRYARVSKNTLRRLIDEGYITAKRLDGKWIVDRLSIDAFYGSEAGFIARVVERML